MDTQAPLSLAEIRAFAVRLGAAVPGGSPAEGIEIIDAIESLKATGAAAQAVVTDRVARAIVAERRERGLPKREWERGVASQVGLARRQSPYHGGRFLGLARALVHEMPHTLSLLQQGLLSEWRAMLLVRETACLTVEERGEVDRRLCADPEALAGAGDRRVAARAAALAAELDPESVVRRRRRAESERRISTRPAPDTMAYFTGLMPMTQAVSLAATLTRDAQALVAGGEREGTVAQVAVDLLYERGTGKAHATGVPVEVNLILSDESLLTGDGDAAAADDGDAAAADREDTVARRAAGGRDGGPRGNTGNRAGAARRGRAPAAEVPGYGPIPAALARRLIVEGLDTGAEVTLRRLYASPASGALTAVESVSRIFPKGLARLLDLRDRACRTPWCDAPIRHHDHITPDAHGGKTSAENGAGLCAACNYAKEAAGWMAAPQPADTQTGGLHLFDLITPTGHHYRSTAPPLPRPLRRRPTQISEYSPIEETLAALFHGQ